MTINVLGHTRPIIMGHSHVVEREFGFMKGDPHFPKEARPTAKGKNPVLLGELLKAAGHACVERNSKKMKLWFFPELMMCVEYDNSAHMVARQDSQPMKHRWWHRQNGGAFWPVHEATAKQLESMLIEHLEGVALG